MLVLFMTIPEDIEVPMVCRTVKAAEIYKCFCLQIPCYLVQTAADSNGYPVSERINTMSISDGKIEALTELNPGTVELPSKYRENNDGFLEWNSGIGD